MYVKDYVVFETPTEREEVLKIIKSNGSENESIAMLRAQFKCDFLTAKTCYQTFKNKIKE